MPSEGQVRDGRGPGYALIETMRWEPATGFLHGERHLARLVRSAQELGFTCDEGRVSDSLSSAVGGEMPLRVRLELSADGTPGVRAEPFTPLPANAVWNLRIAEVRLDRADPLIRHKTTRRHLYERAREEISPYEAEEVLLLNEQGEVCEGTITNIFIGNGSGALLTPALDCGLLPGVLREEMIAAGKAREAVVTREMLEQARDLYVGNSLRGLIRGRLSPYE